jgi:DNA-binding MarR family transcriptional regulator
VADESDDPLVDAFWAVARQLRRQSRETLSEWEIAPSHSRAIGVLMRHGVMRLSALSEHLRIAPRSATEVVDWLQERGFVQRSPDPDDRRATLVSLSSKGRQVGEAIRSARASEAEQFFGSLSATDRTNLARILRKLTPDEPGQ